MKRYILLLTFCLLWPPSVMIATEPDFSVSQKRVVESFAKGNYGDMLLSIKSMLVNHSDKPVSLLFYPDLSRLMNYCGDPQAEKFFSFMRKKLSEKKNTDGIFRLLLSLQEEKYYYTKNPLSGQKITEKLFPVRNWLVCGPYHKYGAADKNHTFVPETVSSLADINGYKEINVKSLQGNVSLRDYIYPQSGVAYASVSLVLEGINRIRVYNEGEYSLFINGRKIIKNSGDEKKNLRIIRISDSGGVTLLFKFHEKDAWNFRVIVTDDGNNPYSPVIAKNRTFGNFVSAEERMDPPYYYLKNNQAGNDLHLGTLYDELDSPLALKYLKRAALKGDNVFAGFMLARFMINQSETTNSAFYLEGWQRMNEIFRDHPLFIPARYVMFSRLAGENDVEAVFSIAGDLEKNEWKHVPLWIEYLKVLISLGYEKEFHDALYHFKNLFPHSIYPELIEASWNKQRSREKYEKTCLGILKRNYKRSLQK